MQRRGVTGRSHSYFDGITSHNGYIVKGHPGCSRYENGFRVQHAAERRMISATTASGLPNAGRLRCRHRDIRNFYVIDQSRRP